MDEETKAAFGADSEDDNTYNGWANRETWLINLHFEDSIVCGSELGERW